MTATTVTTVAPTVTETIATSAIFRRLDSWERDFQCRRPTRIWFGWARQSAVTGGQHCLINSQLDSVPPLVGVGRGVTGDETEDQKFIDASWLGVGLDLRSGKTFTRARWNPWYGATDIAQCLDNNNPLLPLIRVKGYVLQAH
jgi:hypothetical protein